jgi:hypothetical protein
MAAERGGAIRAREWRGSHHSFIKENALLYETPDAS